MTRMPKITVVRMNPRSAKRLRGASSRRKKRGRIRVRARRNPSLSKFNAAVHAEAKKLAGKVGLRKKVKRGISPAKRTARRRVRANRNPYAPWLIEASMYNGRKLFFNVDEKSFGSPNYANEYPSKEAALNAAKHIVKKLPHSVLGLNIVKK